MVDIQGVRFGKEIFHRKNLDWETAEEYLRLNENKDPDIVYMQLYTDGPEEHQMPLDDCEVADCKAAIKQLHEWITITIKKGWGDKVR